MPTATAAGPGNDLHAALAAFDTFGGRTRLHALPRPGAAGDEVPVYINEFWTAKQRAGHSLHEISYRACFKPQLPRFFIDRLSAPGDLVYDPFMGRGTTPLEAVLAGRAAAGNDLNPLAVPLLRPRLNPPDAAAVAARLDEIDWSWSFAFHEDLLAFFHPDTLGQIEALRAYLLARESGGLLDPVDDWIRMVAINRLTGHSPGFFSVYTLPPNQATSPTAQRRINAKRNQEPPPRDVAAIILKKTRSLLRDGSPPPAPAGAPPPLLLTRPAEDAPELAAGSVVLVVTSPPFLNTVDYATDNWLRGWFCGFSTRQLDLAVTSSLDRWRGWMTDALREIRRVLAPGGHVAFEVGEVVKGTVKLEETVLSAGAEAGLHPELVLINDQAFTKTAQCWGVDNRKKGTNTNRVVLFRREAAS